MKEHLGSLVDRSERGKKEASRAGRARLAPGRPGARKPGGRCGCWTWGHSPALTAHRREPRAESPPGQPSLSHQSRTSSFSGAWNESRCPSFSRLLPPVLSPRVQVRWGGRLLPTRNPCSWSHGAGLRVQPALNQEGGCGGAQGVLPALSAGRVPGIMDPHQGPLLCLGFCPCWPAPSAHRLTFKAWRGAGAGVVPVPGSLAVPVSGAQSGLPDLVRPGGFGHRRPQVVLPQGSWDSVQASHFKCPGTAPSKPYPFSILASAHSWPEGGPSLCSTRRHLEMAGKHCSEGIPFPAGPPCSLVSGRIQTLGSHLGWAGGRRRGITGLKV